MSQPEFFRLDGKVALVTGGGQGIGEAIARRLREAGAKVAIFDLQAATATKVAHDIDGLGLTGDVTAEADIQQALTQVHNSWGPVDILVNNAGIVGKTAPVWELAKADMEKVLAVNLVGPFLWAKRQSLPRPFSIRYLRRPSSTWYRGFRWAEPDGRKRWPPWSIFSSARRPASLPDSVTISAADGRPIESVGKPPKSLEFRVASQSKPVYSGHASSHLSNGILNRASYDGGSCFHILRF